MKSENIEKVALLMDHDEDNDDKLLDNHDIIKGTGKTPKTIGLSKSSDKLNNLQNQVDDVIQDMKVNLEKVVDRGQNLNELNNRSEQLSVSGDLFSKRSRNLRKSMWLRTCRARLYLSMTIGFILILIICIYYFNRN